MMQCTSGGDVSTKPNMSNCEHPNRHYPIPNPMLTNHLRNDGRTNRVFQHVVRTSTYLTRVPRTSSRAKAITDAGILWFVDVPAPYCTCIGLTTLACEAGVDEWTNSIGILLRALITLSSYWLLTMYVRIMYSESKAKGTVFAESSLLSERK